MNYRTAEQLHSGDQVFWQDPDAGLCSRTLTISEIEFAEPIIKITDDQGNYLECFAEELQ